MIIIFENLFTNLSPKEQDKFINFIPWFEITAETSQKEVDLKYHITAKTWLSYEGIDV